MLVTFVKKSEDRFPHKYIRKEPGGTGDENYIYEEREPRSPKETEEITKHNRKDRRFQIPLSESAKKIIFTLKEAGHEAYVVGGAVRDSLLDKPAKDFDIVTSARPDAIKELFGLEGSVGQNFAVHLVDGHEVASYRTDEYGETGSAKDVEISLASSVDEDVRRRDFTINGMVYDPDSDQVFDYVGGMEDLQAGVVRFIGDPEKRIREDSIRMLRAIRFANRFDFVIDPGSLEAMKKNMKKMKEVPGERIRLELMKMLEAKDTINGLNLMLETGFFEHVIPELYAGHGVDQNRHHGESILLHNMLAADAIKKKDPVLKMAMLLHDVAKVKTKTYNEETQDYNFLGHETLGAKMAEKILKRLKFSTDEITRITSIIEHHMYYFTDESKDKTLKKFMNLPEFRSILRARLADRKANLAKKGIPYSFKKLLRRIRVIQQTKQPMTVKDLVINGSDLKALGLKPGPLFGTILSNALELVLENPEANDRDILMEFAKKEAGISKSLVVFTKSVFNEESELLKENAERMKDTSSVFFKLRQREKSAALKCAVDSLQGFVRHMHNKEPLSDREFLIRFFGVTENELNSVLGDKLENYVSFGHSEDGHYMILNYSTKFHFATIDNSLLDGRPKWSMQLRICRGIIFDVHTAELVSFPYEKFFNTNEYVDTTDSIVIDKLNTHDYVTLEKIDGIMVQAFYDRHSNTIRLATRSMLDQFEDKKRFIDKATMLLPRADKGLELKNYLRTARKSLVMELVDPEFRVVVDYGRRSDLVLHGIRDLETMEILGKQEMDDIALAFGLTVVQAHSFSSYEGLYEFKEKFEGNVEGYVIRFDDGSMVKIKTQDYFRKLAGLKALNYRTIGDSMLDHMDWNLFKIDRIKVKELFSLADTYRARIIEKSRHFNRMVIPFVKRYVNNFAVVSYNEEDLTNMFVLFKEEYDEACRNGTIHSKKVKYEDFKPMIASMFKFYVNSEPKDKDTYNRRLMKVTVLQLNDQAWMGTKINSEELKRSMMELEILQ
jgi:poly(A) polymerase